MQIGHARVSTRDQQLALAEATAVAAETLHWEEPLSVRQIADKLHIYARWPLPRR
jgi:hypothetical protein